jgi:hypothetical protein
MRAAAESDRRARHPSNIIDATEWKQDSDARGSSRTAVVETIAFAAGECRAMCAVMAPWLRRIENRADLQI